MAAAVGGATAPDVEREDADVVMSFSLLKCLIAKLTTSVQANSLEGRLTSALIMFSLSSKY